MTGRDDDRPERERRSWREIDQMRDGARPSHAPRPLGRAAQDRADAASKQYRKHLENLFSSEKGGAEGRRLARAIKDAHGTSGLADACRGYRDALGIPDDAGLLSLFLDTGERELVHGALEALLALHEAGALEPGRGLRSQLRMLAEDRDDAVAEAAEELLDRL